LNVDEISLILQVPHIRSA